MGVAADENVQSGNVGFSITGGAIGMAIDLLNKRQMINGYTFELVFKNLIFSFSKIYNSMRKKFKLVTEMLHIMKSQHF